MQTMPAVPGVASGRILSAGVILAGAAGLALYQLTSLVLGPVSTRQLDLSLTIPAVEVQDLSEPMAPTISVVVAGPVPALSGITAGQVVATVDAAGKGPGNYPVDVVVRTPPGTTAQSVQPTRVTLTIRTR